MTRQGRRVGVLVMLMAATAGTSRAQSAPSEESCPGILTAPPDLSSCYAISALGGSELRYLKVAACMVEKIHEWEVERLQCLEAKVERVHRVIMYPENMRRVMTELQQVLRAGRTLKQEIEGLACGWRFSRRSELLRDLYLKPVKLCRPGIQLVMGRHTGFFDDDVQEYLDWSSVVSRNMIQERTTGRDWGIGGLTPAGVEHTWQRIANEETRNLASKTKTPGEAIRFGAQLSADVLQVASNTHQLRTQGLLVEQQLRDYGRRKRHLNAQWSQYWLARYVYEGERARGGAR